jgi:CRP/FNR family transcriptional regulator, anaerobic regulatory protein
MDDFSQFRNFLKNFLFLTEDDCSLFESSLRTIKIEKNEFFLEQGRVCTRIGFVNSGCLRTYYLAEGKEVNTRFVMENNFAVDYDSFLHNKSSRYFIQALEPSELVVFSFGTLQHAYECSQNWERFGRIIAETVYALATKKAESFLFMNGEERYLDALKGEPEIFERVPLYHIASYLGLERESLSRLRKKIALERRL